jgi:rare lipoprotein A
VVFSKKSDDFGADGSACAKTRAMRKAPVFLDACPSGGRMAALAVLCLAATGCATTEDKAPVAEQAHINTTVKFSEKEFGVAASPRLTTAKAVPKGGGRYQVGKPYTVRGRVYTPTEDPNYASTGKASWYGPNFHGRLTANGEVYDQYHLSAAHPTMPLPSYARVTNRNNGHSVVVRVNDRGPFSPGRIIDVSSKAAELLDFKRQGVATVDVAYVGPARMDGLDMPFLMASYRPAGQRGPVAAPEGQIATGVMVASTEIPSAALPGVGAAMPTQAQATMVEGVQSAQATAMVAPSAQPAAQTALVSMTPATTADVTNTDAVAVSAILPEIGPVPPSRPGVAYDGGAGPVLTAAYAQTRIEAASTAFGTIVTGAAPLDADAIARAWKRRAAER